MTLNEAGNIEPSARESSEVQQEFFDNSSAPNPEMRVSDGNDSDEAEAHSRSIAGDGSVPHSADSDEGADGMPTPPSGSDGTATESPTAAEEADSTAEIAPPAPNTEPSPSQGPPPRGDERADVEASSDGESVPVLNVPEPSDQALILERMERIESSITELFAIDKRHTGIIEKLHAENTTLRQGELVQAMKPLLLDLARLHDDVASLIAHGGEELRKAAVIPELIVDVLSRHGVTPITPQPGEPFTAKQHQAVETVVTDDPTRDGTIAEVRRPGFLRDGEHLVRAAQVNVYRYVEPVAPRTSIPTTPENESIG